MRKRLPLWWQSRSSALTSSRVENGQGARFLTLQPLSSSKLFVLRFLLLCCYLLFKPKQL